MRTSGSTMELGFSAFSLGSCCAVSTCAGRRGWGCSLARGAHTTLLGLPQVFVVLGLVPPPQRGPGQGMAQASDLDGESRSGGPRTLRVKGCVGLPQTGGFQDVAALPVDEEAPGIEVHLVTRCLEVQGHCGHSRGGQGLLVALSSLFSLRGSLLSLQTDCVRRGLGSLQGGWVGVAPHHGLGATWQPGTQPHYHLYFMAGIPQGQRGFPSFPKGHTPLLWRCSLSFRAHSRQGGLSRDCFCVCMCVCLC